MARPLATLAACAALGAHAFNHDTIVSPLPLGRLSVACSNIEQDTSKLAPGAAPSDYWEGFPVNGTDHSRRAAEVAIAIARAAKAPLTALYVAPSGKNKTRRSGQYEEAILKDIVALADSYSLQIKTAVRTDVAADEAIVKEMGRRRNNLLVLGVGRRPGDKLFFGDTAAALLEKSTKSLVFVAT